MSEEVSNNNSTQEHQELSEQPFKKGISWKDWLFSFALTLPLMLSSFTLLYDSSGFFYTLASSNKYLEFAIFLIQIPYWIVGLPLSFVPATSDSLFGMAILLEASLPYLSIVIWGLVFIAIAWAIRRILPKANSFVAYIPQVILVVIISLPFLIYRGSGSGIENRFTACLEKESEQIYCFDRVIDGALESTIGLETMLDDCLQLSDTDEINATDTFRKLSLNTPQHLCVNRVAVSLSPNEKSARQFLARFVPESVPATYPETIGNTNIFPITAEYKIAFCKEYGRKLDSFEKTDTCILDFISNQPYIPEKKSFTIREKMYCDALSSYDKSPHCEIYKAMANLPPREPTWTETEVTLKPLANGFLPDGFTFDLKFGGETGASGLVSVFLDEKLIGRFYQENFNGTGFETQRARFDNVASGAHKLKFQVDALNPRVKSSVEIKNLKLDYIGYAFPVSDYIGF